MEKHTPKRAAKGESKLFSWTKNAKRQKMEEKQETIRLSAVWEQLENMMQSGSKETEKTESVEDTDTPPSDGQKTETDLPHQEVACPEAAAEGDETIPTADETGSVPPQDLDDRKGMEETEENGAETTEGTDGDMPMEPLEDEPPQAAEAEEPQQEAATVTPQENLVEDPLPNPTNESEEHTLKTATKKIPKAFILVLAVLLVLVAGYAVLCATVDRETALLKTTVNGVDVSGMTQAEMVEAIQANCEQVYGDATFQVSANDETYTVQVGQVLAMDAEGMAADILTRSGGSFWVRGYDFLQNAIQGDDRTIIPTVSDEDGLIQAIEDSGLMKIDTTVQTTYEVTREALVFTMGKTGNSVDRDGLVKSIQDAVAADDYDTVIDCPMLSGEVQPVDLAAIHDKLYQKAVNATLDPDNNYEIVPSVEGIDFDQEAAAKTLEAAEEGSQVSVELIRTEPTVTTAKLENNLFRDVLGECTTSVSGTANRKTNVRLAAEKINGHIMLAGDEFSYNGVVGERTAANGFKTAGAYLNGETVQEYGGGICQVSSTAYLAVLRANLAITERHNHTYVSTYIDKGMDATVSWGGPDLKFQNNRDYPIKIVASYSSNNQVTVKVLGTNVDGSWVKITNEILTWSDYDTEYRNDNSMYEGESYTAVSGEPGGTVQTYRSVYDKDGNLISKEKEAYSAYTRRDKIVYVGTKKKAKTNTTAKAATQTTTAQPTAAAGGGGA